MSTTIFGMHWRVACLSVVLMGFLTVFSLGYLNGSQNDDQHQEVINFEDGAGTISDMRVALSQSMLTTARLTTVLDNTELERELFVLETLEKNVASGIASLESASLAVSESVILDEFKAERARYLLLRGLGKELIRQDQIATHVVGKSLVSMNNANQKLALLAMTYNRRERSIRLQMQRMFS